VPRVYQPDHTSHVGHQLRARALYFATGGGVVVLGWAVLHLMVGDGAMSRPLASLTWWLMRASLLVSVLGLAATLWSYLAYRRRRAGLDAAGAEAEGERRARLYRNR
jgi:hypothetical protein